MRNLLIAGALLLVAAVAVWYALFQMNSGSSDARTRVSASRARRAFESGDYSRALAMSKQLLESDPASAEVLMIAGESSTKLNKFQDALDYYGQVRSSKSEKSTALWASGEIQYHLGRATPCIESLQESIELNPQQSYARERLIQILNICGRRRETLPHIIALMRKNRMTIENLIFVGNLARDMEAVEELKRYVATDKDDPMPYLGLARLDLINGELVEAEKKIRRVLERVPQLAEAHAQLGLVLIESDTAKLSAWNQSLPKSAEVHPDVWFVRGLWLRAKKPAEAVRCLAEAIKLDPNHLKAHQSLAQLLRTQGETAAAQELAAKAEKLQRINIGLERIFKARNYTPTMKEVAELTFELGRIWETMGWCVYARSVDSTATWPESLAAKAQANGMSPNMPHTLASANILANAKWVDKYPLPQFESIAANDVESVGSQTASAEVDLSRIRYADVTNSTGLAFTYDNNLAANHDGHRIFETTGSGIGIIDYDLDSRPDVFFSQGGPFPANPESLEHQDKLFANIQRSDSSNAHAAVEFQDVTDLVRLHDRDFAQGVAVGDINGDGFDDIYVCNIGQNKFWLNCGDGTFEDATQLLPEDTRWTSSAAIADLDFDGLANIYDANYVTGDEVFTKMCIVGDLERSCTPLAFSPSEDRVLTPNDSGNLEDRLQAEGMVANSLGVVVVKMAGSELPHVFVSADQQANLFGAVVKSDNGFSLQDDAIFLGLAYDGAGRAQACMGIAAGDVNGDGEIDLYVTNFCDEYYTLFIQRDGLFEDATASSGTVSATRPLLGFGAQFTDAQLDGIPDLFVLNGHIDDHTHVGIPEQIPPQFFGGLGNGKFQLIAPDEAGSFFQRELLGRSLVKLDYDKDGLEDLLCGDLEVPATLVRNASEPVGRPVAVRLIGTQSDRNAICAIVTLESAANKYSQRLQLTGGSGYQASNERVLRFSVPQDVASATMTIEWPSGVTEVHEDISLGASKRVTAVESQGLYETY